MSLVTSYRVAVNGVPDARIKVLFRGTLKEAFAAGHITAAERTKVEAFTARDLGISTRDWNDFGGITGIEILEEESPGAA